MVKRKQDYTNQLLGKYNYLPKGLILGSVVFVVFMILALGIDLITIVGFTLSFVCAFKCADLAKSNKGEPSLAYVLGFIFTIFALVLYYLKYYGQRKN